MNIDHLQPIRPHSDFCFGRTELCEAIIRAALTKGSVLLFGGRQSGKTTVLLRTAQTLDGVHRVVVVYVDLLTLAAEAGPRDFFALLTDRIRETFATSYGQAITEAESGSPTADGFAREIERLVAAAPTPTPQIVILLDEAARVLDTKGFPRALQDNLFALLYGGKPRLAGRVALVFAGSQELYKACVDTTSPFGTRAAFLNVGVLADSAVSDLIVHMNNGVAVQPELAQMVIAETGGHAGLAVLLTQRAIAGDVSDSVVSSFRAEVAPLVESWYRKLSDEARALCEILLRGEVHDHEFVRHLRARGLDGFRDSRAREQLLFTGVVTREAQIVRRVGLTFWKWLDRYVDNVDESGLPECDVLLVCVNKTELQAMLDVAKNDAGCIVSFYFHGNHTYYCLGEIGGVQVLVVRSEMGSDGPGAALITIKEAIDHVRPRDVVMVGVAFGVNPDVQKVGDVLVSRQLQGYDLRRVSTDDSGRPEIILRADRVTASERLLDRIRVSEVGWPAGVVRFGLVLSGQSLVDNCDYRDQLRRLAPEAIGGEMEGVGLYTACRASRVDWILVKGICDWADGNKFEEKHERQTKAAVAAASLVFHTLLLRALA